ncbi:hypothetical protein [Candidatus Palauibacter sp.]|uniref:hypothetical protein n=1 Tax=Candidatus Palauibacter sp. TaxID=3101350 RepID=UPI003AF2DCA7
MRVAKMSGRPVLWLRPPWRTGAVCALLGCGGGAGEPNMVEPGVVSVRVEPGAALILGVGGETTFSAVVRTRADAAATGRPQWSVEDPRVATIAPGTRARVCRGFGA